MPRILLHSRDGICCLQVLQELVKLDEQELNNKYKIGIIYCKEGQLTEEDMYNNGGYTRCVRACV